MRRILIFSFAYYPRFIGGAEVAIKEITDRIGNRDGALKVGETYNGIEFDMVTLRLDSQLPKTEKLGNINVHRVGWTSRNKFSTNSLPWYLHLNKYAFLITGLWKAISLHKEKKYDAIWSIMANYSSFAAVLFKLVHHKVPYIFTLQDGDPIPYIKRRAWPLYPLFKMIFTRADHIQAISRYLADWARDMGAKCPITVVPNGVDYELFARMVPSGKDAGMSLEELKGKLGKKEGDIFLITVSRLVVKNAVGDIISALQYLPGNVKLLILGQGYQEKELKEQAAKVQAEDQKKSEERVKFLGFVAHKDLPAYLHISDIFIRPSISEGFGNSFIEAMAAGIPVIATPVGGIPDFLADGETGLFCEVRNPKSIAQKVEKLVKDMESRDFIIRNARNMVRANYGWDMVANEIGRILKSSKLF